jgi:hypothetical protein
MVHEARDGNGQTNGDSPTKEFSDYFLCGSLFQAELAQ